MARNREDRVQRAINHRGTYLSLRSDRWEGSPSASYNASRKNQVRVADARESRDLIVPARRERPGESDTIRLQTTLRRRDVAPRGASFIYGGLARSRYRVKLAQSLITAGRILTVNTVATAYNPKTYSRQSGVSDCGPLCLSLLSVGFARLCK